MTGSQTRRFTFVDIALWHRKMIHLSIFNRIDAFWSVLHMYGSSVPSLSYGCYGCVHNVLEATKLNNLQSRLHRSEQGLLGIFLSIWRGRSILHGLGGGGKKKLLRFQRHKAHLKCTLECVIWKMQHTASVSCSSDGAARRLKREEKKRGKPSWPLLFGWTRARKHLGRPRRPTRLAQMSWVTALSSAGLVNERVPPSVGSNWSAAAPRM